MGAFRKKLQIVVFVVMTVFTLTALELCTDCDLNAKAPASCCCVQCCPSHHLALTPKQQTSMSGLVTVSRLVSHPASFHSDIFPSRIDRPPIA